MGVRFRAFFSYSRADERIAPMNMIADVAIEVWSGGRELRAPHSPAVLAARQITMVHRRWRSGREMLRVRTGFPAPSIVRLTEALG